MARYAAAAFESLQRIAGDSLSGARVLDFGCGTGLLTRHLSSVVRAVVSVDTSLAMIEGLAGKNLANVVPVCAAVTTQLLRSDQRLAGAFDLVVCSSVCAFVEDYPGTIATLASALGPGGLLVQWDWERAEDDEESLGLSRSAIREALSGAGLEQLSVQTGFSIEVEGNEMAPLMGVGRKAAARSGQSL
ncbi:MAG: class I SAM-dependent methyltransferase [Nannocystaceae bacterium]|nr:class I SAM-dependent methyltransferase [Nannocystaceae bacterium]